MFSNSVCSAEKIINVLYIPLYPKWLHWEFKKTLQLNGGSHQNYCGAFYTVYVHIVAMLQLNESTRWQSGISVDVVIDLNGCPAELPCCSARGVVDEQRFAVPEAPTPRVHPAAQRSNGRLCCSDVVLFSIIDGFIPTALVVMMMRVMAAAVTAALTWTHTGHGAQRAGQLSPCLAAGWLWPKAWRAVAACCCMNINSWSGLGSIWSIKTRWGDKNIFSRLLLW